MGVVAIGALTMRWIVSPSILGQMGLLAVLTYLAFALALLWSAVRHRQQGWLVGAFFALLLLSPALIFVAMMLYEQLN